MTTIEKQIVARLYRISCPDPLALGEYQTNFLAPAQSRQIRQHLKHCPHCRQELHILAQYLPDPHLDRTPAFSQRVKIWIAERLRPQRRSAAPGTPAIVTRGAENDTGPLLYQAGDVQLTLEVEDDPDHPGYKMILGLVLGATPSEMTAHLWQSGRPLAANPVDESGNFIFTQLAAGEYELILSGADQEIHVQDLPVHPAKPE